MEGDDCKQPCSFMREMKTVPVLQVMEEMYSSSKKKSVVLGTGLAVLEYSLHTLSRPLPANLTARVDGMAGEGLCRLMEKYPTLQQPPSHMKDQVYTKVRTRVRSAMRTFPGRLMVGGLDWVIDRGEGLLKTVKPRDSSPRKRKSKQAVKTEHAYAAEETETADPKTVTGTEPEAEPGAADTEPGAAGTEPGAADKEQQLEHVDRSQQTTLALDKLAEDDMILKVYKATIVLPIEILVVLLKAFRRFIAGKRNKRQRNDRKLTSQEKTDEIGKRRKVSPRKKLAPTLLGRWRQKITHSYGFKYLRAITLYQGQLDGSYFYRLKRKHDDIYSDEGSATEEDLENFDFDNYHSEDDPDYQPGSDSEVDYDSDSDGVSESDLEEETVETEAGNHFQLKDKTITESSPGQTSIEPATSPTHHQPEIQQSGDVQA